MGLRYCLPAMRPPRSSLQLVFTHFEATGMLGECFQEWTKTSEVWL
jgi:hypothetical protein